MRYSLVSDCNLLIKKASTRKGEAFCVKGDGGVLILSVKFYSVGKFFQKQ